MVAAALLAPVFLLALAAQSTPKADSHRALETALSDARLALEQGEPQLAESHFRTARLEGWNLLGLLAVAGGDFEAAREAFATSKVSAAAGVYRPRLNQALLEHQRGEPVAALIQLRVLTDRFPALPEPWEVLARALVLADRFEEAREISDKLHHVLPQTAMKLSDWLAGLDRDQLDDVAAPRIDLGPLAGLPAGERRQLRQRIEDEMARVDASLAALRDAPSPTETLVAALDSIRTTHVELVGDLESGRFKDAEVALRKAQQSGDSPALRPLREFVDRARRGTVAGLLQQAELLRRGTSPKVMTDLLRRAFERAPSSEEVLRAYGRASLEARLIDGALNALAPLAGLHPEVAEYHVLHGQALLQAKSVTEAIDAFNESVRRDPKAFQARLLLGQALNSEKRYDEAETHLRRALELVADDLDALAALAEAEQGLGDLDSAEDRAEDILARAPTHTGARFVLGMVRMKQNRYAEARETLEEVVAADPRHVQAFYQLSLACMRLGDRENAERHLDAFRRAQEGTILMTAVSGPIMEKRQ